MAIPIVNGGTLSKEAAFDESKHKRGEGGRFASVAHSGYKESTVDSNTKVSNEHERSGQRMKNDSKEHYYGRHSDTNHAAAAFKNKAGKWEVQGIHAMPEAQWKTISTHDDERSAVDAAETYLEHSRLEPASKDAPANRMTSGYTDMHGNSNYKAGINGNRTSLVHQEGGKGPWIGQHIEWKNGQPVDTRTKHDSEEEAIATANRHLSGASYGEEHISPKFARDFRRQGTMKKFKVGRSKPLVKEAAFDESKHKRDESGKFAGGGGGAAPKASKEMERQAAEQDATDRGKLPGGGRHVDDETAEETWKPTTAAEKEWAARNAATSPEHPRPIVGSDEYGYQARHGQPSAQAIHSSHKELHNQAREAIGSMNREVWSKKENQNNDDPDLNEAYQHYSRLYNRAGRLADSIETVTGEYGYKATPEEKSKAERLIGGHAARVKESLDAMNAARTKWESKNKPAVKKVRVGHGLAKAAVEETPQEVPVEQEKWEGATCPHCGAPFEMKKAGIYKCYKCNKMYKAGYEFTKIEGAPAAAPAATPGMTADDVPGVNLVPTEEVEDEEEEHIPA